MSRESERVASTRDGKTLIHVLMLMLASRPFSQCLSTLMLTLVLVPVLASLVKTRLYGVSTGQLDMKRNIHLCVLLLAQQCVR